MKKASAAPPPERPAPSLFEPEGQWTVWRDLEPGVSAPRMGWVAAESFGEALDAAERRWPGFRGRLAVQRSGRKLKLASSGEKFTCVEIYYRRET